MLDRTAKYKFVLISRSFLILDSTDVIINFKTDKDNFWL